MFWGLVGGGCSMEGGECIILRKKNRKIKQIDCTIPEALDQVPVPVHQ